MGAGFISITDVGDFVGTGVGHGTVRDICHLPYHGQNYDAAVLAAGHCGFGLGATPTAIANMQAITDRFGPSHLAFLVVPMVGAFLLISSMRL